MTAARALRIKVRTACSALPLGVLWFYKITAVSLYLKTSHARAALLEIYATRGAVSQYLIHYTTYFQHLIKIGERCFNKNVCCELHFITQPQLCYVLGTFNYYALLLYFLIELQPLFPAFVQSQILYYFNLLTWTLYLRETTGVLKLITTLCKASALKTQRHLFLKYFAILITYSEVLRRRCGILGLYGYVAGKIGVRGASRTYFLKMRRGLLGWRPHKFITCYDCCSIATSSCVLSYKYAIVYI